MKKFFLPCLMLVASFVCMFVFVSCGGGDDDDSSGGGGRDEGPSANQSEFVDQYFSIDGAVFHGGAMPESTSDETITGVEMNNQGLAGGFNFISISTDQAYDRFYVGVDGQNGYMEFTPTSASTRAGEFNYIIPLALGSNFSENLTVTLIGRTILGALTRVMRLPITYVASKDGELTINLTFNRPRDLDLHLLTPSGKHIFYYNTDWSVTTPDGEEVWFGLDHDSNANCNIDNLNNENIVIPSEAIEPGIYQIYLEMYENCEEEIGKDLEWRLVVRYNGVNVQNMLTGRTPGENSTAYADRGTTVEGRNPVYGKYPYNAITRTQTYVMDFEVASMAATRGGAVPVIKSVSKPSMSAIVKYLDSQEGIR